MPMILYAGPGPMFETTYAPENPEEHQPPKPSCAFSPALVWFCSLVRATTSYTEHYTTTLYQTETLGDLCLIAGTGKPDGNCFV